SHFLLQPVQAQPPIAFKTPEPAISLNGSLALTFEAEGTACYSYCEDGEITSGTFVLNHTDDGSGQVDSGTIQMQSSSSFINQSSGVVFSLNPLGESGSYVMLSSCSTSDTNVISVLVPTDPSSEHFKGGVECPVGGEEGEAHSAQPTSSTPMTATTTTQDRGSSSSSSSNSTYSNSKDGDGDGIPDSSDNCTHNSNPRCFKEGDTNTTQQQFSTPNRTGNQTR
ncbi:MAG TPA: thrombospondin type 3 repeat-containing protein, partial [Nitrososphaera sp.]|nr:thrombospondin type 3 repeat-containing protein [Nitrososphaera sp.]